MSPCPSSNNFPDHFRLDRQLQCGMNLTSRHPLIPHGPNKQDLGFRQLCHVVIFSSCLALLILSIFQIVLIRSKPEMGRINARAVSNISPGVQEVTIVQDLQAGRNISEMQNPGNSMGFYHRPPFAPLANLAIPLFINGTNPYPTAASNLDSRKESIAKSCREALLRKKVLSNVSRHNSLGQSASLLRLAFLFNRNFDEQAMDL